MDILALVIMEVFMLVLFGDGASVTLGAMADFTTLGIAPLILVDSTEITGVDITVHISTTVIMEITAMQAIMIIEEEVIATTIEDAALEDVLTPRVEIATTVVQKQREELLEAILVELQDLSLK